MVMSQLRFPFVHTGREKIPGPPFVGRLRENVVSLMARAMAHVCRIPGGNDDERTSRTYEDHPGAPRTQSDDLSAAIVAETGAEQPGEPTTAIRDDRSREGTRIPTG